MRHVDAAFLPRHDVDFRMRRQEGEARVIQPQTAYHELLPLLGGGIEGDFGERLRIRHHQSVAVSQDGRRFGQAHAGESQHCQAVRIHILHAVQFAVICQIYRVFRRVEIQIAGRFFPFRRQGAKRLHIAGVRRPFGQRHILQHGGIAHLHEQFPFLVRQNLAGPLRRGNGFERAVGKAKAQQALSRAQKAGHAIQRIARGEKALCGEFQIGLSIVIRNPVVRFQRQSQFEFYGLGGFFQAQSV